MNREKIHRIRRDLLADLDFADAVGGKGTAHEYTRLEKEDLIKFCLAGRNWGQLRAILFRDGSDVPSRALIILLRCAGMHCLGAVTAGTSSPNGVGGRDGTLSVFRALGVLVCEGRIQGPPRGYKEGPHCAPPMQAVPNDHVCEENNYLVSSSGSIWRPRYSPLFLGDLLP